MCNPVICGQIVGCSAIRSDWIHGGIFAQYRAVTYPIPLIHVPRRARKQRSTTRSRRAWRTLVLRLLVHSITTFSRGRIYTKCHMLDRTSVVNRKCNGSLRPCTCTSSLPPSSSLLAITLSHRERWRRVTPITTAMARVRLGPK